MIPRKKYDMSFVPDMGIPNIYPSPQSSNGDGESSQAAGAAKAPAKRKRENRYKNAPPSVLSVSVALVAPRTLSSTAATPELTHPFARQRRRAQNRASQRAYRERKDQRIKDLEAMLNEAKQKNDVLSQAYAALHAEYIKLTSTKSDPYEPTIGVGNGGERFDMDMFVYQDMSGYNL
jgi:AP-1-like transcription factor